MDPTHNITRILVINIHDSILLGWVHYWAILSPRLADSGIEAVHVPVIIKNQHPVAGCVPLIQYDLGVKYQKGQLKTSLSDKNELLRIQAVFIANFMVKHQNIHLHVSDSAFIGSGQDPQALEENITHKSLNITAA